MKMNPLNLQILVRTLTEHVIAWIRLNTAENANGIKKQDSFEFH